MKGTFVHQFTAHDLDKAGGGIVYRIHSYGNEYSTDMFAINSVSGIVTLEKSLDYETLDKHVLTIKATETDTFKRYGMSHFYCPFLHANFRIFVLSILPNNLLRGFFAFRLASWKIVVTNFSALK